MRFRSRLAAVTSVVVVTVFAGTWSAAEKLVLDLTLFTEPSICVQVLSLDRHFTIALSPDRFDQFIDQIGPDFTMCIEDEDRARSALTMIHNVSFNERPDLHIDTRYRFLLKNSGETILVFHANRFGTVSVDGAILVPSGKSRDWLSTLWGYVWGQVSIE